MTQTPPQRSGPPAKLWDALPQIIDKLTNEFLLVTLGILILVVAIGVFASGVVESLGRAFFYLIVVLAWLAYLIVRVLDTWVKLRTSSGAAVTPPPAPAGRPQERPESEPQQAADQGQAEAGPVPSAATFDQRGQTVQGSQTNIGQSEGPVLSGTFHAPVSVGTGPAPSTPAPAAASPAADQGELDRLHQVLNARFDREELRTLCFKLDVSYDDLRGEGHSAKARELVLYMSRRTGGLERLREVIEAERPGVLGGRANG
jgi:hypothetical protein